jgi:hypothetical protein
MTGEDVGDLFSKAGVRVFARNVRGFLGSTQINRAMEETLAQRPGYFWYFNNGVTIVCDDAQRIEKRGKEVLRVENPQIINGQQTTRVLESSDRGATKASVLVRVIRIPRDTNGSSSQFEDLVSRVVEATNWQNAIRASDLMTNDRQQILIERELRKVGYQYLRKRQTKREARRTAGGRFRRLIAKEELAQAVAACELDPAVVRAGKERLFEERWYGSIFGSSSPAYYLNRYWMMKHVTVGAKGYPDRAYAKWLVLSFVWDQFGREVSRRSISFRQVSESPSKYPKLIGPLDQAIDRVFISAIQFYRKRRGSGPKALDISTFFKRRRLDKEFLTFWRGQAPPARAKFRRASDRFLQALKAESQG